MIIYFNGLTPAKTSDTAPWAPSKQPDAPFQASAGIESTATSASSAQGSDSSTKVTLSARATSYFESANGGYLSITESTIDYSKQLLGAQKAQSSGAKFSAVGGAIYMPGSLTDIFTNPSSANILTRFMHEAQGFLSESNAPFSAE
jgi:hypothetical protein